MLNAIMHEHTYERRTSMNEEQRKEQAQLKQEDISVDRKSSQDKPLSEKSTEDFAHYFLSAYQPADMKKARTRGRDNVEVHYDFEITADMRSTGEGRKFLVQTYGCQMNE